MLGIALGVAALIIVLSVMNGFQKEVRDRMLSVIAHVEVFDAAARRCPTGAPPPRGAGATRRCGRGALRAAQALVGRGDDMRGAVVRGIDPARGAKVTDLARTAARHTCSRAAAGRVGIVLGGELARLLGVRMGDKVTMSRRAAR
jgi:lipoprotein-releasing system permease protein